jgi:2,3-diketo-5-methylthio-1-phosphopentane phosphatase
VKYHKLKIFCDFDGTVTQNDVWVNSLGKFIKDKETFQKVCYEFDNAFISARECIRQELNLVEDFNFDKFNEEVDNEKLDIYFGKFISYCNENSYDIFLISEGLDYYINRILKREGLEQMKLFCNKMTWFTGKYGKIKLSCEFPYSDEVCSYCGMSKRNILISNTNDYDNEISVLIGDGTSDFCVASYADMVFAKRKLASYCWKHNITYFEYNNFNDIIHKIEKLKEKRQLKQRQTARCLRRDVFLGG